MGLLRQRDRWLTTVLDRASLHRRPGAAGGGRGRGGGRGQFAGGARRGQPQLALAGPGQAPGAGGDPRRRAPPPPLGRRCGASSPMRGRPSRSSATPGSCGSRWRARNGLARWTATPCLVSRCAGRRWRPWRRCSPGGPGVGRWPSLPGLAFHRDPRVARRPTTLESGGDPTLGGLLDGFDREVTALATRIAELGEGEKASVYRMSWWSDRMLGWAMSHPSFKTQLFRFVDVFPATHSDAEVLRHVREYFDGPDVPKALDLGVGAGRPRARGRVHHRHGGPAQHPAHGRAVHRGRHATRGGGPAAPAVAGRQRVRRRPAGREDRHRGRGRPLRRAGGSLVATLVRESAGWAPDDHLERDDLGPLPRVQVSIKPTALATHYAPLTRADGLASAKARLRPLLADAPSRSVLSSGSTWSTSTPRT